MGDDTAMGLDSLESLPLIAHSDPPREMRLDEASLLQLTAGLSVTRRSSTSSVDTIVANPIKRTDKKRNKRKEKVREPCKKCTRLISGAIEQLPSSKEGSTIAFANIYDLQHSASECPMCRLLWDILRGTDDTLVHQILNYDSGDFNVTGPYLPDGGTDIEELLNPGPKVRLAVIAQLDKEGQAIRRRLKRSGRSADMHKSSLSLKFKISYRTHANSRGLVQTYVHEEVAIFREPRYI